MMASQFSQKPRLFLGRYLAAIAAAFLVLGGHFWMVESAGSPVPVHDQWLAEGEMLYVPLVEHRLNLGAILHPHAEHRIVPTRVLALTLFKLNDHVWDVRLQMTVNAVLAAILAGLIVVIASRQLSPVAVIVFAACFGGLLASPLFYGNALWGFQSQFYFLLLFSVVHMDLVLRQPVLSRAWMLGVVASGLAGVSMGSGFVSALLVGIIAAWNLARGYRSALRRAAAVNFGVHAAICAVALGYSAPLAAVEIDWPSTLHTLVHCLSWPTKFYTPWGAWVWLPFLFFLGAMARRSNIARNDQVVLALGLWVLVQIVAISVARGTPALVITPRYYEIFWLGLAANALALHRLGQLMNDRSPGRIFKVAVTISMAAWILSVSAKSFSFAQSHWRYDLPAYRGFAQSQVQQVKAYLAGGEISVLQALPYPQVPHPDANYLASQLRNPIVRGVLPPELSEVPAPPASRWATAIRRTAIWWLGAGTALLVASFWFNRRSAATAFPDFR